MTTDARNVPADPGHARARRPALPVTFNYRYIAGARPGEGAARRRRDRRRPVGRLSSGCSTPHHGADYFRRWHSQKKNSGGLMVHKATHHFDLVNWWLSATPVSVRASGRRASTRPRWRSASASPATTSAATPARRRRSARSSWTWRSEPELKSLYLDQEKHDGYFRDRCVFRPEIDIEDSMNVVVTYDSDAILSYSLNAASPWEGYEVTFNGTKGRLEHKVVEQLELRVRERQRARRA